MWTELFLREIYLIGGEGGDGFTMALEYVLAC